MRKKCILAVQQSRNLPKKLYDFTKEEKLSSKSPPDPFFSFASEYSVFVRSLALLSFLSIASWPEIGQIRPRRCSYYRPHNGWPDDYSFQGEEAANDCADDVAASHCYPRRRERNGHTMKLELRLMTLILVSFHRSHPHLSLIKA